MKNVSFRIEEEKLKQVDNIAKIENTDHSSIINQLISEKIDLSNWQLEKIETGIIQLDNTEYSKDTEIIKLLLD